MYLIRDIFRTKPGKAKELVSIFKKASPFIEKEGGRNPRLMTDFVADYWTVELELETDSVDKFLNTAKNISAQKELGEIMKGYMDLVIEGHREIYRLE